MIVTLPSPQLEICGDLVLPFLRQLPKIHGYGTGAPRIDFEFASTKSFSK